jgi:hypothetical protein
MRYYELFESIAHDDNNAIVLALALRAITDLPIVALMVGNDGQRQRAAYVMVRASEDTFLDANGSRALVEIMADTAFNPHGGQKWEVREITPELLLKWSNGKRFPVITKALAKQAKDAAKEIVARLGDTRTLISS